MKAGFWAAVILKGVRAHGELDRQQESGHRSPGTTCCTGGSALR